MRLTQGWGDGVVIEKSATIEIRRVVGESAKIGHVYWATYHVPSGRFNGDGGYVSRRYLAS